ncbi:MAG TPA: YbaB/EbfC family nucleoid-associated protein [Coriobacteriia bacterium]|nr:YbaB/EbfC family nucleoid-associated protein [Coriobacteriia bacterium]
MKPNLAGMMKQAQKMQADMARVQAELADSRVESSVGGGAVKVVMTGDMTLDRVAIDPAAVDPDDVAMLEDLVAAAVNDAIRQAQSLASTKMAEVTGGMNIPGLT